MCSYFFDPSVILICGPSFTGPEVSDESDTDVEDVAWFGGVLNAKDGLALPKVHRLMEGTCPPIFQ